MPFLGYIWYFDSRNHTYQICRCGTLHFEESKGFFDKKIRRGNSYVIRSTNT